MSDLLHVVFGPDAGAVLAEAFLRANLAAAAAILTVAAARIPARQAYGPQAAYALWLVPPLAAVAALLLPLLPLNAETAASVAHGAPLPGPVLWIWVVGAVAMATLFAVAQARFLAEVRAGRGGPAVVGLISPRIVLPADDGSYSAAERELIRAHERAHVARKDPRAVAFVALAQCVCWFNPFVHLAARLLRLDQELACDAAVVLSRPRSRGLYARTLLKTQLASTPLPFGCYWPARGAHPLEVRVALLKRRTDKASEPRGPGGVAPAVVEAIRP
jgi:beta-lactamase regulating signal transducer with metallopeptidase domain